MDELKCRNNITQMHKKVKEVAGTYKKPQTQTLYDESNQPNFNEQKHMRAIHRKYI